MKPSTEYTHHLNIQDLGLDAGGSYCLRLTLEDIHLSRAGQAHGGLLFTLLDAALGRAAMAHVGGDFFCPTVEMKINYFRPVASGSLETRGRVVNTSAALCYAEGDIHDQDGRLIARATGTFFIKPRRGFVKNAPG